MLISSTDPSDIVTRLKKNIFLKELIAAATKFKLLFKFIMSNSAIWQQAAYTTYQLFCSSCLVRAGQKSTSLYETYGRMFRTERTR